MPTSPASATAAYARGTRVATAIGNACCLTSSPAVANAPAAFANTLTAAANALAAAVNTRHITDCTAIAGASPAVANRRRVSFTATAQPSWTSYGSSGALCQQHIRVCRRISSDRPADKSR